ncbi:sporulation protein YpjB [Aquibacillus salsiterrae]|uniref:Sporulation protein YpjB n=1 Tax=Aquibacillus salsiterrae TaxID=2950439 RepID=A0A9X3WAS1_9BACI|nr:sporulation protein YpjB [Aquibacillus salsiterrae]MDC3415362.1 sporulation protein YpjB [Aquibacillus salsiterrae]
MNHLSKYIVLISITVLLGIQQFPSITFADHSSLTKTIYQFERLIEERRFATAKELLVGHKDELITMFKDEPLEVENDMLALIDANIKIVDDPSVEWGLKIKNALALVLAVDSIRNENDPLWINWKSEVETTLATTDERALTEEDLQLLNEKWAIIKPALQLSLSEEQYKKVSKSYQAFYENPDRTENVEQLITVFRDTTILDVSNTTHKKDSMTFIWLIFVVGGLITLTLSYVAWKKYKAEKNKNQRQPTN